MLINLISIVLFTSWPQYLPIFLQCARYNPDVRFTLITNLDEHHPSWNEMLGNTTKPSNVILAPYTFEMIVAEIQKNKLGLGMDLKVKSPYKLIDFKPMYGVLFRKELIGFSHWGWFDLDIYVGNIKATYECGYANEDFVSYDQVRVHGPLMILRNTDLVNNFYLNMLSYPATMTFFQGKKAILFDEVYMPYLIKKNSSVAVKHLQGHNCDSYVWMWYKGNMHNVVGPCVIHHFGGGGTKISKLNKASHWSSAKNFFTGDYQESGNYGYGEVRPGGGQGKFAFVFTFRNNNEFMIVNSTSQYTDSQIVEEKTQKYNRQLSKVAAKFHLSDNQCPQQEDTVAPP